MWYYVCIVSLGKYNSKKKDNFYFSIYERWERKTNHSPHLLETHVIIMENEVVEEILQQL